LALVAREGNSAPGTSDHFDFIADPILNDAGQTAVFGYLDSSETTDRGIWAEDGAGVLTLIARAGDLFDVDDGPGTDFRTIDDLRFTESSGQSSGFNNSGQLAFQATFTDGSSGVFVSNRVAAVSGDFDQDNDIDGADFLKWQRGETPSPLSSADLDAWKSNYGNASTLAVSTTTVPEPSTLLLGTLAIFGVVLRRSRRS
jgi:hypothetical protein